MQGARLHCSLQTRCCSHFLENGVRCRLTWRVQAAVLHACLHGSLELTVQGIAFLPHSSPPQPAFSHKAITSLIISHHSQVCEAEFEPAVRLLGIKRLAAAKAVELLVRAHYRCEL